MPPKPKTPPTLLQQAKRARDPAVLGRLLAKAACEMDNATMTYLLDTKNVPMTPLALQELARTGQVEWVAKTKNMVSEEDRYGAMLWAANNGHVHVCQELWAGCKTPIPRSVATRAVRAGQFEVVTFVMPHLDTQGSSNDLWEEAAKSNKETFVLFEQSMSAQDKVRMFYVAAKHGNVAVATHLFPTTKEYGRRNKKYAEQFDETLARTPRATLSTMIGMIGPLCKAATLWKPLYKALAHNEKELLKQIIASNNTKMLNVLAVAGLSISKHQGFEDKRQRGLDAWELRRHGTPSQALSLIEAAMAVPDEDVWVSGEVFDEVDWNIVDFGALAKLAQSLPKKQKKFLTTTIMTKQRQQLEDATAHGGHSTRKARKI